MIQEEQMYIKPLFLPLEKAENMGAYVLRFNEDDYNKTHHHAFIDAKTDAEAISAFLQEYRESPNTLRSYAKEIERLLLWCIHIGKVNVSGLRRNHLLAYQEFLKNPSPSSDWCGPKVPRECKDGNINPQWRPFCSGLTNTSIRKSIKIIDSFFNYLTQTQYLIGNPMAIDKRRKKRHAHERRIVDRYLELDEIHAVLEALDDYPVKEAIDAFQIIRARYIILLLFYTGLRIFESSSHTMGDFLQREKNWFLRILGKGRKLREIPIPDELMTALAEFRLTVGLKSPQPNFKETTPLIPMQNLKQPISARRIDQILRFAFTLGATRLEASNPNKASKLMAASAHWLRHSYVTYLLNKGAPLKVVQENAGHSDISTTMLYRHVTQIDRHEATRDLSITIEKASVSKDTLV